MSMQRIALSAYYRDLFWYTIQKYLFECHPLRQQKWKEGYVASPKECLRTPGSSKFR